jgi:Putative Flp pilus-assembly TadE/G-like
VRLSRPLGSQLSTRLGARRRDESGAVAVLVGVLTLVLFGIAALVVDLGLARDTRRQAQNAADSAALAAANTLYLAGVANPAAAVAAAKEYAADNFGTTDADWARCTDPNRPVGFTGVSGETACISFSGSPGPNEVRVVVPTRSVETPLGRLMGVDGMNVGAAAQAGVDPGGRALCGLCVIGPGDHDVQNGGVTVAGTSIYVNGTLTSNPQMSMTATGGQIYLEGNRPSKGTFTPQPYTQQPAIPDPLAFLSLPPPTTGLQPKTVSACSSGGGPGIYSSLRLTRDCVLAPGTYVVTGSNHESGRTHVTADGVTMYFGCQNGSTSTPSLRTCAPGEKGGDLLLTGQASLAITAPTSGLTAGLAMVADRNNTATFGWRGNGAAQSTGTIYFKSGTLDYRGNGAGAAMDSLVVVGDLQFSGAPSGFNLVYNESSNVELPAGAIGLTR